ncbi:PTS system D-fructose-specific IIA component (F1P-forming) (Frc family) /PTS system D-fructose-specific IIB component (F1P-forming) (Frc family) /PTS system D-fructose-specific IIC component (F1P-forming) (Frc family) [Streptomyces puniciscabiei]|uniref:PTS system D-fructose-specific IIA component (F1P-forming) (Frc family) /PTS system D-fructose-specific IIB component (F1P-forming) (Frc family) /PTS system D-fructose-specific IIC component (F1P-f... n=2 Tax=Streptomyces puniciscabiei TaxID=164348 RepID=A0A542UHD0_9ACTN|nr:fructose-specific PTS transporter subunit EIIC [Streptomyces puniciscabiei]TQK98444.1 PTS system D-fructose-specific IIA component (F1P-forming) (Frc family) /PTS system D-fructose-specific IIB component (F1P-forming) (Frc family) /PTS system D-fructose-specific IIC component (F1P-forming) (Frc family) [Streptomyces puniciscabiei]
MSDMITADLVDLDLSADTKEAAARALAERMVSQGRVTDLEGFLADVAAREAQMPTGLDGGIGIPHCRSAHVTEPTLAFGRSAAGIDFGAADGPADLIFLIAAPAGADDAHLTILSSLARQLMNADFTSALRAVTDARTAAALIRGDETPSTAQVPAATTEEGGDAGAAVESAGAGAAQGAVSASKDSAATPVAASAGAAADTTAPAPGAAAESGSAPAPGATDSGERPFRIVAVTSCPTGIAHTYMAAESLENAGREAGVELVVETQGSAGFTRLDPALIAAADAVIFAHDVPVRDKDRFAGKPTVDVGVKAGINRPAELITEVRGKAARGETSAPAAASGGTPVERAGDSTEGYGTKLRKWLMSGVSYMVPFVAAGGLLIALGFAIGGYKINKAPSVMDHFVWTQADSWGALMFQIGVVSFGFLVPVLAGYIAYGMADRPGLVPGFVGGAISVTINAGFLGGLAAGLIAGGVVLAIQRVRIPAALRGIMPVVVIPLISAAIVGFLMFVVIGKPIATAQKGLTDWLNSLTGTNAILLGALLGLMMCFDLGGPVNKVAYTFATAGIAVSNPSDSAMKIMAAVMAAGMVPPLAMALATTVRGRLFTRTERENGKAAWVLGASFISEGAIPFAAADPLRVIPSAMIGGALTGALSMAFGATLRAPHGGIFVVPLIGNPFLYLIAIAAGVCATTALVVLLKGMRKQTPETAATEPAPNADATTKETKQPVAA